MEPEGRFRTEEVVGCCKCAGACMQTMRRPRRSCVGKAVEQEGGLMRTRLGPRSNPLETLVGNQSIDIVGRLAASLRDDLDTATPRHRDTAICPPALRSEPRDRLVRRGPRLRR